MSKDIRKQHSRCVDELKNWYIELVHNQTLRKRKPYKTKEIMKI